MRLVEVNVTACSGSTGRIAEAIGRLAIDAGWDVWMAYGRSNGGTQLRSLPIGGRWNVMEHGVESRLLDNHGLASRRATRQFLRQLDAIRPDLVHLHNIHGYYLNYPLLFRWLKEWGGPVVWTLHDLWPFTGHCAYFGVEECPKWKTGCGNCPRLQTYPAAVWRDRSETNFRLKRNLFTSVPNLTLVPVSHWLSDLVGQSFLGGIKRRVIHNGVDTEVFAPQGEKKPYILGVASVWEERKGLPDFVKLRQMLPSDIDIKLVGLTAEQISKLSEGIEGISRTNSQSELAQLYSGAVAFVNPTYEDNFPTVNIEALAAGTPVVTYRTGGSPEAVDAASGVVVERGDVGGLVGAIERAGRLRPEDCRRRALDHFRQEDRYREYLTLFSDEV